MNTHTPSERRLKIWTAAAIAAGLVLTGFYWSRSQVAGDQLNMLARGWLLAAEGQWIHFGLGTSAGGKAPGSLTSVLVGLPLMLWQHHRSPTAVLILLNLIAYLLLDRIVDRELGPMARLIFATVYWLNPWRLYHSGFLWNSSYLLPIGALHFWTLYRQRHRPSFWQSFLQVLLIGLAAQLHASVVTLVILSLVLWWRGYFRFDWRAVAIASALVAISLIPWALSVVANQHLLPSGGDRPDRIGRSLLSVVRGLGYWIRYPAMIGSSTILCLDFGLPYRLLSGDSLRQMLQAIVGLVTLPPVIWANLRLWKRSRGWWHRQPDSVDFVAWLSGVIRWSLVVIVGACLVTPTAVMSWQLLSFLHLAVMPLVLLGVNQWQRGGRAAVGRATLAFATLSLIVAAAVGWGSPMFRCGGETCGSMNATPPPLRADHPMLDELGIQVTCAYEVDVAEGWWPDVLPER